MKNPTREQCAQKYEAANVLYRKYLDRLALAKFGQYSKAAKAVQRSRAHLNDCINGKRGLDSVKRLVDKMESVNAG